MDKILTIENFWEKIDATQFYCIIDAMQVSVYWKDIDGVYLGCNKYMLDLAKTNDRMIVIGKTDYEMPWKDTAGKIHEIEQHVIRKGETFQVEETSIFANEQKERIFLSTKSPLVNKNGQIVGVIGTSVEITSRKEAEALRSETERQRIEIAEQEKFAKVANQVAHDMCSPLSSLNMIVNASAEQLPEDSRIALLSMSTSVTDIANRLLVLYKKDEVEQADTQNKPEPMLLSLTLLEILTNKRYQYNNAPVTFKHEFGTNSNFVFIKVDPVAFKRMLSNLINNAVDAFEGKPGKVTLKLITDHTKAKIIIEDNGKGIPENILQKIRKNVAIISGKAEGHGIGLGQVRDALEENNGEMVIESKVGKGTIITLTFAVISTPKWLANEIPLIKGDTVVILDDDPSIHNAWEMKFKDYANLVRLKHFTIGEEAIGFVNASDKSKILLLTDYELLQREINGLHVIKRTKVPRSILVTSHTANHIVRNLACESNTKMLPKQLAAEVPIKIVEHVATTKTVNPKEEIEVVVIEDNEFMADTLKMLLAKHGKKADVYRDGNQFLENYARYNKDTLICVDYTLGDITGVDIAEVLHEAGYTNLYLLTGWDKDSLDEYGIPDYLTILFKLDTDQIIKVLTK
jgi:signal transduction histidine kinase